MASGSVTWEERDGRALWNGRTLAEWAGVLVEEVVEVFHPVEVWLFGSLARSDDDGDSDIDLLVVLDHYDPADAINLKVQAARSVSVPAPFDVAFSDPERLQRRQRIAGTLERVATSHGRVMYRRG